MLSLSRGTSPKFDCDKSRYRLEPRMLRLHLLLLLLHDCLGWDV